MKQPDFTKQELGDLLPVFAIYKNSKELPTGANVQKGSILEATSLVDSDPIFGGSEILILGYDGSRIVLGTSLQRGHPAYLKEATWGVDQIEGEIGMGAWNLKGSLEGSVIDYFKRVNSDG